MADSVLGFFPPSHGSIKEKLYDWYHLELTETRSDSFCPSPDGIGFHAYFLKNFFKEKLLKEMPALSTRPVAP